MTTLPYTTQHTIRFSCSPPPTSRPAWWDASTPTLNRRRGDLVQAGSTTTNWEQPMIRTARAAAAAAAFATAASGLFLAAPDASADRAINPDDPVDITVLSPERGSNAGISGAGWFVDLEVDFEAAPLAATGFSGLQLTGPAGHNNIPPAPGLFGTGH